MLAVCKQYYLICRLKFYTIIYYSENEPQIRQRYSFSNKDATMYLLNEYRK